MNVSAEWLPLAKKLLSGGLAKWIQETAVFSPGGEPVVSGLFAVAKGKVVPGTQELAQRLICNFVPIHAYLHIIQGDVENLPYVYQWNCVFLEDGEVLTVSQEDMQSAFYLFALPDCWQPYFAVGKCVSPAELGISNDKTRGYLSICVLPMGWSSSVGIMQHAHERIMLEATTASRPAKRGTSEEDRSDAWGRPRQSDCRLAGLP